MGILCACLPVCWPIVVRLSNAVPSFLKLKSLSRIRTRWGSQEHKWPSASRAMSSRSRQAADDVKTVHSDTAQTELLPVPCGNTFADVEYPQPARYSEEPMYVIQGTDGRVYWGGNNVV